MQIQYELWWKNTNTIIAQKLNIDENILAEKRQQFTENVSLIELYQQDKTSEEAANIWIAQSGIIRPWDRKQLAWAISEDNTPVSKLLVAIPTEQVKDTEEFVNAWAEARNAMLKLKDLLEPEFEIIHKEMWADRFVMPCTCGKILVKGTQQWMITGEDDCCVHGFGEVVENEKQLNEVLDNLEEVDSSCNIGSKIFVAHVRKINDTQYEVDELHPPKKNNTYKRPSRKMTREKLIKRYFMD